ncbi:MAG: sugar phosphate nucleotidyltransferase, partial [bacterium]
ITEQESPLQAIIMAGGFGTRLYPLTKDVPKPMLPFGDKPLLHRIVDQLAQVGIRRMSITTHYKSEVITDYFGNGDAFGVSLSYIDEDTPMGTAGSLSRMAPPSGPTLVMNSDILTDIDFQAMLSFHQEHHAEMTVAVRAFEIEVPYGVFECDGPVIKAITEKPSLHFFVNAGIYILEPEVYRLIPRGRRYDMTDLIHDLLQEDLLVISFPIREYWQDIGQHADYEKAQDDLLQGRVHA